MDYLLNSDVINSIASGDVVLNLIINGLPSKLKGVGNYVIIKRKF